MLYKISIGTWREVYSERPYGDYDVPMTTLLVAISELIHDVVLLYAGGLFSCDDY
jgi:hypothetical protein